MKLPLSNFRMSIPLGAPNCVCVFGGGGGVGEGADRWWEHRRKRREGVSFTGKGARLLCGLECCTIFSPIFSVLPF